MAYKHIVRLSAEERTRLERLIATGKNSAATLLHARILLKADANHADSNWEDVRITVALDTSISTVLRIRKAFVEQGWMRHCIVSDRRAITSANLMGLAKPSWSPSPAARRPRDVHAGPCNCWPTS